MFPVALFCCVGIKVDGWGKALTMKLDNVTETGLFELNNDWLAQRLSCMKPGSPESGFMFSELPPAAKRNIDDSDYCRCIKHEHQSISSISYGTMTFF